MEFGDPAQVPVCCPLQVLTLCPNANLVEGFGGTFHRARLHE
jgi:hypothetical protein